MPSFACVLTFSSFAGVGVAGSVVSLFYRIVASAQPPCDVVSLPLEETISRDRAGVVARGRFANRPYRTARMLCTYYETRYSAKASS